MKVPPEKRILIPTVNTADEKELTPHEKYEKRQKINHQYTACQPFKKKRIIPLVASLPKNLEE